MFIEGKSPADLIRLAEAGAHVAVDGRRYAVSDLIAIARALRPKAFLTIANSEGKSTTDLISIVSAAPERVAIT